MKNINLLYKSAYYKEEELRPEATVRKYRIVQTEGERQIFREVVSTIRG